MNNRTLVDSFSLASIILQAYGCSGRRGPPERIEEGKSSFHHSLKFGVEPAFSRSGSDSLLPIARHLLYVVFVPHMIMGMFYRRDALVPYTVELP